MMLMLTLLAMVPVIWGVRRMFESESGWGWWSGFVIAGVAGGIWVGIFLQKMLVYRYEMYRLRMKHGGVITQELTLNRHGVRYMQTGLIQKFYPWWQVELQWKRRHVEIHLLLAGMVLRLKKNELTERQVEQVKVWSRQGKLGTKCVRCGYDLRGVPGVACPECGEPFATSQDLHQAS